MHGAHVARTKWSEVKSKVVNLKLFILFLYRTTVFYPAHLFRFFHPRSLTSFILAVDFLLLQTLRLCTKSEEVKTKKVNTK